MPSFFVRTLLIATSLAPVLWTFALIHRSDDPALAVELVICSVGLVVICKAIINWAVKAIEHRTLRIKSLKVADQEVLAFVITYLLPLATVESAALNTGMIVFVIVILAFAIYHSSSYHFNPLLGLLFRYHFYEVGTEQGISYVLLSRRSIDSIEQPIVCVRVSQYLMLDTTEEG